MRTIYITGIKKYQISVIKGLMKSDLEAGKDYIIGLHGTDFGLVWISEELELKELKKAIGSKFVWKHRMRFYESYDSMKPVKEGDDLSDQEVKLLNDIRNNKIHWQSLAR